VLAYLGPGEPFNLVPALDGRPNLASVDAVIHTVLYIIPCEGFRRIMRDHHEVALAVMERLAAEVRRLSDMVEDLALHTVRTRLARFLLAQAEGAQPPKRWTQEEIAAHIGTVRDVVGRTLRTFADDGLIRRERGRLVVVDRAGLEREAMMNG
jgi:CRP/FNR family transcriptional regulator